MSHLFLFVPAKPLSLLLCWWGAATSGMRYSVFWFPVLVNKYICNIPSKCCLLLQWWWQCCADHRPLCLKMMCHHLLLHSPQPRVTRLAPCWSCSSCYIAQLFPNLFQTEAKICVLWCSWWLMLSSLSSVFWRLVFSAHKVAGILLLWGTLCIAWMFLDKTIN